MARGGRALVAHRKTARMAAIYPMRLCKAMLQGCHAQPREDGRVSVGLVSIGPRECDSWSTSKLEMKTENLLKVQIHKEGPEEYKDSVTGQTLIPSLVQEARRKEMEYVEAMKV